MDLLKTNNMRTVHELTPDELEELRSRWFHQHLDDGSLEVVAGFAAESDTDIPMGQVIVYYEDTCFVDEDFFCNT